MNISFSFSFHSVWVGVRLRAIYHNYVIAYDPTVQNDPYPTALAEDLKDTRPLSKHWMFGPLRLNVVMPKPSYGN